MSSSHLFSELECHEVADLLKLQDFSTLRSLLASISSLSKVLVALKSKSSDGNLTVLHGAINQFTNAVGCLEDRIYTEFIVCSEH